LQPHHSHLLLLEDGAGGFVVGDALGELAQFVVAGGIDLQLLHGVVAGVVQRGGIGGDGAVVGGEVGLERDGLGKLIDDIAGRQDEIDVVAAGLDRAEVDGPRARFAGQRPGVRAEDARTDKQEIAGVARVVRNADGVAELQRAAEVGGVFRGEFLDRDAVEIAAQALFEVVALLLLAALGKGHSWPFRGIAESLLDHGSFE
jgi:hypothetical protein